MIDIKIFLTFQESVKNVIRPRHSTHPTPSLSSRPHIKLYGRSGFSAKGNVQDLKGCGLKVEKHKAAELKFKDLKLQS